MKAILLSAATGLLLFILCTACLRYRPHNRVRMLRGHRSFADKVTGNKELRAEPYAAQVQGGNIKLLVGGWNGDFLDEQAVA